MNYLDSICNAAQQAMSWEDVPEDLLPLLIISEASILSVMESDQIRYAPWR